MRPVWKLGMLGLIVIGACSPDTIPARRATASALEPHPDWSMALPQLLPAIRACLANESSAGVAVTKAWPITSGLTGVRVQKANGDRVDCIATENGRGVLLTEPVRTASRLEGERDPLFTPGAAKPPRASCVETSSTQDASGADVGWLSYDTCDAPRPVKPSAEIDPPSRPSKSRGPT